VKRALALVGMLALAMAITLSGVFAQRGAHYIDPSTFTHPDLAVEKIAVVSLILDGGWAEVTLHVVVRNIGSKSTPPCNVMLNWCRNAEAQQPVPTWLERTAGGIKPGDEATVVFEIDVHNYSSVWQGMLIATVDPPVAGKPAGEINEWPLVLQTPGPKPPKSETNNVFGVIFDCGSGITPMRWDNPLVTSD